MGITFSQFFPPKPTLTEHNLPRQEGKVVLVTGGASGIGFELCTVLYQAGAMVYLAGRSEKDAQDAISKIEALPSESPGELVYLPISLDDLTTIKPAVESFNAYESRLDVLFNNAGVSNPPSGSVSPQGTELQMATNCLGPYLLTQLLLPTLLNTAKNSPPAAVRVIWAASIAIEFSAPQNGMNIAQLETPSSNQQENYTTTKTGNYFLANALAAQAGKDGICSIAQSPGNLKTQLTRHIPRIVPILTAPLLYHPRMGAYTALWAAFSPDLGVEDSHKYVLPWGRIHPSWRPDILSALKTEEEGGSGVAAAFLRFCEEKTADFR